MSTQDRERLIVLRQVQEGMLKVSQAARRLDITTRQVRRLRRRFEAEGDSAVIHRARGRRSNRRLPDEVRARALEFARQPLYHDFGPTLLSEHLAWDPAIGEINPSTLRLWLIEEGRWQPEPRKLRHRRRRERRPAMGELVLMDTSIHAWLEERSSEEIVLVAMIDDATSRLFARFVPRDTGAANRQLIVDYLERHGRMGALYTDRASHFGNKRRTNKGGIPLEEREAEM
ncbi:MAG: helix-turn-helix domain-containing protein, partial [Geminicoccaceae bacterium]